MIESNKIKIILVQELYEFHTHSYSFHISTLISIQVFSDYYSFVK
jgi:hypothetical protein